MAEQDFEKLLATLKQINSEMTSLAAKITQTKQAMVGMENPAERLAAGRQLGGYQTAFVRKTQQSAELSSQAMTEIRTQKSFASISNADIERRMNLIALGVPLTTQEILAKGREVASRALAQQREILANAQKEAASTRNAVNVIPHPPGTPAEEPRRDEANIRAQYHLDTTNIDAAKQQEELLRSLRHRVSTEEKYTQALEQAAKLGFTINDLQKVQTRGVAGIERVQFGKTDPSGVYKGFDTFVTPGGRATPGVSNQFRTFGQGVLRDIGEFTKWSIALAAVYGPMKKLQELTQIMIENQTKLAEATISVSSSFLDQSDIFGIAADQANKAGESITGVIDAFTQAYRATGGAGDQVERLATAQNLLNDSLILSKLSTLDQASAIDTLSAALRQTGGNLNNGTELLDKWVRVTKIANVDLASLATGFAVLGDAAEAAQISTDELNGILAAIGETGVASGRELANTARAIVAGFQSEQAQKAIEGLGIAFEDSSGKARPFLEIMKEISDLRRGGIINDTEFSKLTLALGGGTRRQAAYATFIENFSRVGQIAAESARANGDAQAALAKQLETVQTSLTRLGNAFQELAQTLGTEGGFLGIITEGVNGLTSMVKIFEGLTSILGKATPALAAFIATSAVLKYQGKGGITGVIGNYASGLGMGEFEGRLAGAGQGLSYGIPPTFGQRFRAGVGTNLLGTNVTSGIFQGLMTAAIPALLNATNKEDRYGKTKAGADIIGGVGGGIVGALVAGSPLIGSAVGTAIAEAFINTTVARKTDIFGYQGKATLEAPGKAGTTLANPEDALRQAETNLYKSIGFGSEGLGKFLTTDFQKRQQAVFTNLNKAIEARDRDQFENLLKNYGQGATTTTGLSQQELRVAFANNQQIKPNTQIAAYNLASEDARREYDKALAVVTAKGGTPNDQQQAFTKLVEDNKKSYESILTSIRDASKQNLSQQRLGGDIKGAEYGRRTEAISGFDVKALQYYTALGGKVNQLTGGTQNAAKAFEILNNVIVEGSQDSLPQMTSLVGEIQNLVNLLDNIPQNKDALKEQFGGVDEAQKKLEELRSTLAALIEDSNKQVLLGRVQVPDIQGDINKPLTRPEFGLVSDRAKQLQDQFYRGFLKIPDDMYNAMKGSWKEWAQIVTDSGNNFYEKVKEIDPQFFQQAMQQLIEEGKLASQQTNPFGIQQLDITSKQGANLQGTIDYFSKYLSQNFPQYQQKPEEFGVIFSDYVTDVLHGDNLAVKLALEKLVDINQKQLDGMYNIPEGATFWVPLTAAYYRPKNEGGAGLPGGTAVSDTENTTATQLNTQAISELTAATYQSLEDMRAGRRYGVNDTTVTSRTNKAYDTLERLRLDRTATPTDRSYDAIENIRGNRGGRPMGEESQNWLQEFFSSMKSILSELQQYASPGRYGQAWQGAAGGGQANSSTSFVGRTPEPVQQTVSARLDLRFDNNTQLIVDGRVLASVITPYLASDLIKLEASQGTITKRYVI